MTKNSHTGTITTGTSPTGLGGKTGSAGGNEDRHIGDSAAVRTHEP